MYNRGNFYALPQSPQLFKQLLMMSGYEKYFQIVRCFRDEDLRADRQPEFTQLDLEMSFPQPDRIFEVIEPVVQKACEIAGLRVSAPFPRITYREAMESVRLGQAGSAAASIPRRNGPIRRLAIDERRLPDGWRPNARYRTAQP